MATAEVSHRADWVVRESQTESTSQNPTMSAQHQHQHQHQQPTPTPTLSPSKPLSPAYLEARTIFTHLLTTLTSPSSLYHTTYAPWITAHGIPHLATLCLSCIRPPVWTFLSTRWSLDALKRISPHPGDLRYEGRAIYLNGILGVDKQLRVYIGQATNFRQRVGQHLNFRYRRDHASLHYWALEWSVWNVFAVLCVLPDGVGRGGEDERLLLNVLEMGLCLVFRSLPVGEMERWLPLSEQGGVVGRKTAREGLVGGLNIACPLEQSVSSGAKPAFVDLSGEEDELVRGWLSEKEFEREKKARGSRNDDRKVSKVEDDDVESRKRAYREKAMARAYGYGGLEQGVFVPGWVLLGVAGVVVGWALWSSKSGPGRRWR